MTNRPDQFSSVAHIVTERAKREPNRPAFTYLSYARRELDARDSVLTYSELDADARRTAAALRSICAPGDRALLLFRPGLDFVRAFLGCLYAGVIAVPVQAPARGSGFDRVAMAAANSGATAIVSTADIRSATQDRLSLPATWLLINEGITDESLTGPTDVCSRDVAFLQYSSGSTGEPKGVMVTQGNLRNQASLLVETFDVRPEDTFVTWLPHFHDMGLITSVVVPLLHGTHSVLMAPEAFVQSPARWLRALSRFNGRHCTAPDFAYELCLSRIEDAELAGVDLSRLKHVITGAEPVRAACIEAFSARFSRYGFSSEAFCPSYGLAEATLMVTGRSTPRIVSFHSAQLERHASEERIGSPGTQIRLVSCGRALPGVIVRIVDPETTTTVPDGHVGEIWVHGESVGAGYWGRPDESHSAFSAELIGDSIRYLRTGDLGLIQEGELFVRGRLKDLILVRGANHHAPDIEQTVLASHPGLAGGVAAAFSVDDGNREDLYVLAELPRSTRQLDAVTLDQISEAVRQALLDAYQLRPHTLALVIRSIPRTSSGKVRRAECRRRFLAAEIEPLHLWQSELDGANDTDALESPQAEREDWLRQKEDSDRLSAFLRDTLAELLGARSETLHLHADCQALGASADQIAQLARAVERSYGNMVPLGEFLLQTTLAGMVEYLIGRGIGRAVPGEARSYLRAEDLAHEQAPAIRVDEPIAIVGMACRLPGASNVAEFWKNLCDGVDAITEIPEDRWDREALYDPNPLAQGKMSTKRGGFLRDIESFDRRFFNISSREAVRMDPAHRLLLEVSWEALENAAIAPSTIDNRRVGVFVGISGSDYAQLQFGDEMLSDAYAGIGCALTNSASRISHFLNLTGPALAVDTACSSSLTALHLACQSLRTGDCEMALAGGVNIILSPSVTMSLSKAGMMAPDGRCKAFDQAADGYVRAEGVGLVVVKPLSRALADGDPIHAIIRGSASNQDGRSSVISAPNGEAQQRVVLAACRNAGIQPGDLDYVEAHGTGTAVGDPIEVNALGEVLKFGAKPGKKYAIGSVKTAIGHAESAAGIASIIKACLVARERTLPPNLHYVAPNPQIAFDELNIKVQQALERVPDDGAPLRVGVNSFGIGGTNVHFVIEQHRVAIGETADREDGRHELLTLSAKTDGALRKLATRAAEQLTDPAGSPPLKDLAFTLNQRRELLPYGVSVIASSREEAAAALAVFAEGGYHIDVRSHRGRPHGGDARRVAFVFSGQGSQWHGMGRQLLAEEPVFRDAIERCDTAMQVHTGWSLMEVLALGTDASELEQTRYAQPTLFALQYAVCELLKSWGVEPAAVVGHSLGEIAAACVSGAVEFEDACRLVSIRGRLMQEATGRGMMVSVEASRADIERLLVPYAGSVSIAATNGPSTTVVSGDTEAVRSLLSTLEARGLEALPLPVNYAFHSHQVDHAKAELVSALHGLVPRKASVRFMSTVNAAWQGSDDELDCEYWGRNMREEVRFADAVRALHADGFDVFVEIGPSPVLSGLIRRSLDGGKVDVAHTLERGSHDRKAILATLAALRFAGVPVNWFSVHPGARAIHGLSHYPWERERCWLDAPHHEARRRMSTHPYVSVRMPTAIPTWSSSLDIHLHGYLTGIRIGGEQRLSNGLLVELALEAAATAASRRQQLVDLEFPRTLPVAPSGRLPLLQTAIEAADGTPATCRIHSQYDDSEGKARGWSPSFECRLVPAADDVFDDRRVVDVSQLKSRYPAAVDAAELYRKLVHAGVEYERSCQVAATLWADPESALIRLRDDAIETASSMRCGLHPLVYEALEQCARVACGVSATHGEIGRIRRVRVFAHLGQVRPAYAYARARRGEQGVGDVGAESRSLSDTWLLTEEGAVVAAVEGVEINHASGSSHAHHSASESDSALWHHIAQWSAEPLSEIQKTHASDGLWVLIDGRTSGGTVLARWLREHGGEAIVVDVAAAPADADAFRVALDATLQELSKNNRMCRGVVLFAAPDCAGGNDGVRYPMSAAAWELVQTVQSVTKAELMLAPRLWVVTRGGQAVEERSAPTSRSHAMVWGAARSIAIEHAELRCSRIDLDPAEHVVDVPALGSELLADTPVDQIALRAGARSVLRLIRAPVKETAADALDYALETDEQGATVVRSTSKARRRLGREDVEVEVQYAEVIARQGGGGSLAARQVFGSVVRVGADVTGLMPGQAVFMLTESTLGSHVVTSSQRVFGWPADHPPEGGFIAARACAASLLALREIGTMGPGSRVLIRADDPIEAATAAQVARLLGARAYVALPSAQHGSLAQARVDALFDEAARSTSIVGINSILGGQLLDIVVNFSGRIDASDSVRQLKPFGRLIDFGSATTEGSGTLYANLPTNVAVHRIDFDQFIRQGSSAAGQLAVEAAQLLASGRVKSPPIEVDALDTLQVPLSASPDRRIVKLAAPEWADATVVSNSYRDDEAYVITGGLGGLGLKIAERMVIDGARKIALLGRSQPGLAALDAIAELEARGASCNTYAVDVSDAEALDCVLQTIRSELGTIGGVIHAAGVLDNALAATMSPAQFGRVMPSKVDGAIHLDTLTRTDPLRFFVLFSSLASMVGSPGQSNYAAANAFIEALALDRRSQGLPGLAIAWGPWAEVGMASDDLNLMRLEHHGIGMIAVERGLDALDGLISEGTSGVVGVLPMNWEVWGRSLPYFAGTAYFGDLVPSLMDVASARGRLDTGMLAHLPKPERIAHIKDAILRSVCQALRIGPESVDTDLPLAALGLDSIIALELKGRIESQIDVVVRTSSLIGGRSIDALAVRIHEEMFLSTEAPPLAEQAPDVIDESAASQSSGFEDLSKEEIEALLASLESDTEEA